MTTKPGASNWTIKEQIIEDAASGLTFQFEVDPESSAPMRLRIFGDLPFGNREIVFDRNGEEAGSGTALTGLSRPTWLTSIEDSPIRECYNRRWR